MLSRITCNVNIWGGGGGEWGRIEGCKSQKVKTPPDLATRTPYGLDIAAAFEHHKIICSFQRKGISNGLNPGYTNKQCTTLPQT